MDGTEYTLTGFDDFLERRRVVFVEPLPSTRVCGVCGVVPSQSLLLPCGDVLCQVCKGQTGTEDGMCPLDGMTFTEADIVSVSFKQCHLEQHRVFCIAGGGKCDFAGKLSELKDHLAACRSDQVTCAKCRDSVVRSTAAEHHRQCSAGTSLAKSLNATLIASAIEKLSGMKKDLEELQARASSGKVEQDGVVNCANFLVERMASIEHDLIQIEQVGGDKYDSLVLALKQTVVTAIPHHAASKPGVFIATCVLTDIYAGYISLNGQRKECSLSTDIYVLAGYTFRVYCNLKRVENKVLIHFTFYLRHGAWDDWVEWPFSKMVTVIIRHPRDEGKDIRLPLRMEDPKMVRKPSPNSGNSGESTEAKNWDDLELQGFFLGGKDLFVNVVFQ